MTTRVTVITATIAATASWGDDTMVGVPVTMQSVVRHRLNMTLPPLLLGAHAAAPRRLISTNIFLIWWVSHGPEEVNPLFLACSITWQGGLAAYPSSPMPSFAKHVHVHSRLAE